MKIWIIRALALPSCASERLDSCPRCSTKYCLGYHQVGYAGRVGWQGGRGSLVWLKINFNTMSDLQWMEIWHEDVNSVEEGKCVEVWNEMRDNCGQKRRNEEWWGEERWGAEKRRGNCQTWKWIKNINRMQISGLKQKMLSEVKMYQERECLAVWREWTAN